MNATSTTLDLLFIRSSPATVQLSWKNQICFSRTNRYIKRVKGRKLFPIFLRRVTCVSCDTNDVFISIYESNTCKFSSFLDYKLDEQIRTQMIKRQNDHDLDMFFCSLIAMYSGMGDFHSAAQIFIMGSEKCNLSWSFLVGELYRMETKPLEILELFRSLLLKGVLFTGQMLVNILSICMDVKAVWLGLEIHSYILKFGYHSNVHLMCVLMNFYARNLGIEYADQLFEEMLERTSYLLRNAVILYAQYEKWFKCLELFKEMQFSFFEPDPEIIIIVLRACGKTKLLSKGREIHGYILRNKLETNLMINNSLITMYVKNVQLKQGGTVFQSMLNRDLSSWNSMLYGYASNGFIDDALHLFEKMRSTHIKPDLVTWNSLISAFSIHVHNEEAVFKLFRDVQGEGLKPNDRTITSVLQKVSGSSSLNLGKEIHGYVTRNHLTDHVYVGTSLVNMYIKCLELDDAQKVFANMNTRNIYTWNSLISGFMYVGRFNEALYFVNQMKREGVEPDLVTWNSLVSGYSMRGHIKEAVVLFRQLKLQGIIPNVVLWTSLISGCCRTKHYVEGLEFFTEMTKHNVRSNTVTFISLLPACAELALLDKGKECHCYIIKNGHIDDIYVSTSLVNMYCKCGDLQTAYRLFGMIDKKNTVSWNVMIMGFAIHGQGKKSIALFDEMISLGIKPDGITFVALLSGCRHSGLISEGWIYFDSMKDRYGIIPTLEHYACMVDLLSRSGYLDEAWDIIQTMPLEPDASVWGALLGSCKIYRNLELGEISAKYLFKLEPNNSANYLIMMDLYAMESRWDEVEDLENVMKARGLLSRPGWSWIDINKRVHVFSVNRNLPKDIGELYFEIYQLMSKIKRLGYVPDIECVTKNISEEEKEKALSSHTEKLAISYGLIHGDRKGTIRVINNSRVCNDCHEFAKYVSKLTRCEIILRDGIRFHHLVDGKCSCDDFW